ncbi:MAG: hypothetical protein FJ280_29500, partial [Planctomycetes bacterium]|nr:hypothetical protein [Planctomycetota bacterium]
MSVTQVIESQLWSELDAMAGRHVPFVVVVQLPDSRWVRLVADASSLPSSDEPSLCAGIECTLEQVGRVLTEEQRSGRVSEFRRVPGNSAFFVQGDGDAAERLARMPEVERIVAAAFYVAERPQAFTNESAAARTDATAAAVNRLKPAGDGQITGTVTAADGATPLPNIRVSVYRYQCGSRAWVLDTNTDGAGQYAAAGLEAGTYQVRYTDPGGVYATEWYDDSPTSVGADEVVVATGGTTAGINAALAERGRIAGLVTGADGVTPLAGITVEVYSQGGSLLGSTNTDTAGQYNYGGLEAGNYKVYFRDPAGQHAPEWYDDALKSGNAKLVAVSAGATTEGINASLAGVSRITGTVTGPNSLTPLGGIRAKGYWYEGSYWQEIGDTTTDVSGGYSLGGLVAGVYLVRFEDPAGNYVAEYYNDGHSSSTADSVSVGADATVAGVDVSLAAAGRIRGTVTNAGSGSPLANTYVSAYYGYNESWQVATTQTASNGVYELSGLIAGPYRLRFSASGGTHRSATRTGVTVTSGATTADVNAALVPIPSTPPVVQETGNIAGRVTGPDGVTPLAGVQVVAYNCSNYSYYGYCYSRGSAQTGADGRYEVKWLPTYTSYVMRFNDPAGVYAPEYYQDSASPDSATRVSVSANTTTQDINASLSLPGQVSGVVTDGDGNPLACVRAEVYPDSWSSVASGASDETGRYTVGGLLAAAYRVRFTDLLSRYASEWYNNASSYAAASNVIVTSGNVTGGVDAQLAPRGQIA